MKTPTAFEKMQQSALLGKLTVPDRVLFRGHLKLRDPRTLGIFLAYSGVLLKDFGAYAEAKTAELKAHAERLAAEAASEDEKLFIALHAKALEAYNDPYFDPLRSDPRFKALLKKVGLGQ